MGRVNTGTVWEHKIRDYLRASGYTVVRSAGSKGAVDLVAWNEEGCLLIQAKKEIVKRTYKEDTLQLDAVKCPIFWKKQLWVKLSRSHVTVYDVHERELKLTKRISIRDMNALIKLMQASEVQNGSD